MIKFNKQDMGWWRYGHNIEAKINNQFVPMQEIEKTFYVVTDDIIMEWVENKIIEGTTFSVPKAKKIPKGTMFINDGGHRYEWRVYTQNFKPLERIDVEDGYKSNQNLDLPDSIGCFLKHAKNLEASIKKMQILVPDHIEDEQLQLDKEYIINPFTLIYSYNSNDRVCIENYKAGDIVVLKSIEQYTYGNLYWFEPKGSKEDRILFTLQSLFLQNVNFLKELTTL